MRTDYVASARQLVRAQAAAYVDLGLGK